MKPNLALGPITQLAKAEGSVPAGFASAAAYLEIVGYVALSSIIACLKSPVIVEHPRFWAEEGSVFYVAFLHLPWYKCLFFIKSGSLQLLTNIAVYASTKVPVIAAPAVTVYISFIFYVILAVQLGWFIRAYNLAKPVGALLIIATALLPQTFEVWLNTTNLQWMAGLSCLLVFVMPSAWISAHWKGTAIWCFILGLSGIPATILAPVFLARTAVERSLPIAAASLGLCAAVIVQFAILEYVGGERRPYPLDLYILLVPLFLQSVVSPLLSADTADRVGRLILSPDPTTHLIWLTIVLPAALGIMAFVTLAARNGRPAAPVLLVLLAWVFVPTVQNFGSIAPGQEAFSGWVGGRYFLFGSFCLCILVAWGSSARNEFARILCICMLLLIIAAGIYTIAFSSWPFGALHGPSWHKQIDACAKGSTCQIKLWPDTWTLQITK